MALSNDLISQFVKMTNDEKKVKSDITVNGTVKRVEIDELAPGGKVYYVQLDGAAKDVRTPATSTTTLRVGDRAIVSINNHTATAIGNATTPSVTEVYVDGSQRETITIVDQLIANRIQVETEIFAQRIETAEGEIDDLQTKKLDAQYASINYATINSVNAVDVKAEEVKVKQAQFETATAEDFEAVNAEIESLKADHGEFDTVVTGDLNAVKADIQDLKTNKLDVSSAAITYANIDFSNIGKAAMEYIFAQSGLIKDVVINNGNITGHLIGVTISGDLIEGNTVKAEKLVIKGSDGLYYKLNTDGMKVEAQQSDQNSLNGSIIKAKSITATKISVEDLVAFDATIGGFNITESAIYSGVKESINNTTKGIYLDKDGQAAIGDSTNFIKYFLDTDGKYKLAISASSITLSASGKSVEQEINTLTTNSANADKKIEDLSIDGRNLLIQKGSIKDTYVYPNGVADSCDASLWSATIAEPIKIEPGATYTFSKNAGGGLYFRFAWYDKDMNLIGRTPNDTNEFTWTAPSNAEYILISYPYNVGARPKFEKGSVATTYCLAIEDVDTEINKVDDKFVNYSTTAEMNAAIEVSKGAIRSEVSTTYTTKQEASQTYSTKQEVANTYTTKTEAAQTYTTKQEAAQTYTTKDEFNDLEIGAKNLIKNSSFANDLNHWVIQGVTATAEEDSAHGHRVKIVSNAAGSASQRIYADTVGNFTHSSGKTYALSFYARADVAGTKLVTNVAGDQNSKTYTLTTDSWVRYTNVYTAETGGSLTFWIADSGATAYITKVQLENGDKVTDWKLSPDDMATNKALDNVSDDVTEAKTTAADAESRVTAAETIIEQLSDTISSLVTDENGTSLMTQTSTGWKFDISSIQKSLDSASEAIDMLTNDLGDTGSVVSVLEQAVKDLEATAEYIRIGTYDDEPCIEMGEADSNFRILITNTRIIFYDGTNETTYIRDNTLHTNNVKINKELQQGDFVWSARSNGNYGLIWRGN